MKQRREQEHLSAGGAAVGDNCSSRQPVAVLARQPSHAHAASNSLPPPPPSSLSTHSSAVPTCTISSHLPPTLTTSAVHGPLSSCPAAVGGHARVPSAEQWAIQMPTRRCGTSDHNHTALSLAQIEFKRSLRQFEIEAEIVSPQ